MIGSASLIIFGLLANILCIVYSNPFVNVFIKNGNSYEASFGNEYKKALPDGYVEKIRHLLNDYKAGKIRYEGLNTFNKSLEEYFLFRLYELRAVQFSGEISDESIQDSFSLPVYSNEAITLKNVSVSGFPGLKKGGNPVFIAGESSSKEFKVTIGSKSDVIVFSGNITIYNSTYAFVYTVRHGIFETSIHAFQDASKDPIFLKNSLQFITEELVPAYNSSDERYTEVNKIFVECFNKALLGLYLPALVREAFQQSFVQPLSEHVAQLATSYQKLFLSALVESAMLYATAKGLNSFEVTTFNFTDISVSPPVILSYKKIEVEGILNFINHELIDSTIEFSWDNVYQAKLADVVQLIYPVKGEKQAFISFVISDGTHEGSGKLKIKNIRITAVYNSTLAEYPLKVFRNKEIFNGTGFSVQFELDDFNPTYVLLTKRVSNYIAHALERSLGPA